MIIFEIFIVMVVPFNNKIDGIVILYLASDEDTTHHVTCDTRTPTYVRAYLRSHLRACVPTCVRAFVRAYTPYKVVHSTRTDLITRGTTSPLSNTPLSSVYIVY